ncbi:MAG: CDP-diacylglycerol--glycerol-3-phosphate 3-phosphatidyltransferase [Candidatus Aminicenantes bacterium]|nr:CDP-diacylglycerol--glycerol-3-phosphate 3-phosphatidyltransferase [Candidatus Aminicenantes bacterium]
MNLPNALTSLRILLIPFFMVFLLVDFTGNEWAAFGVFLFATLTDTVDGLLARRTNKITTLGQLLDPIADKLLMTAAFVCLVGVGRVPAWMAVVIIGREIAVTGFRAIAASKGVVIAASWPGKLKMQLETGTIALLILGEGILGKFWVIGKIGLWLTMAVALYSAAEYFIKHGPELVLEKK